MEDSIAFAKKFTEDVLSFFGLNAAVDATHDEEVIQLSVPSTHLNGFLIGHNGETLRSLQLLISAALRSADKEVCRVSLDVAGYKKQNEEKLIEKAKDWISRVRETKQEMPLQPMNAAERRIVHREVSESDDLMTESVGEGRDRHIVIKLAE